MNTLSNEIVFHILSFTKGVPSFMVCTLWYSLIKEKVLYTSNVNSVKMVKWAIRNNFPKSNIHVNFVKYENLKILKWLDDHFTFSSLDILERAIVYEKINVIKRYQNLTCIVTDRCLLHRTVELNKLKVVKYILTKCKGDVYSFNIAVCSGFLEMAKYLYFTGCRGDCYTMVVAARSGNVDMFKWLTTTDHFWCKETCKKFGTKGIRNFINSLK